MPSSYEVEEGGYSRDTEILTRNGWELFSKLTDEEEVATRSEHGVFEWQLPSARLEYPFDGEMVEFSNKSVDLLVTPGHRMLVKRPDAYIEKHEPRDGERGWHIRLAENIARTPEMRWLVPSTSRWCPSAWPAEFVLPGWEASRRHPAHERATELLAGLLKDDWTPSAEVLAACKAAGIGEKAYQAARKNLGIKSRFFGGRGKECWWEVSKPTLCRARTCAMALSWCFLCPLRCSSVLADQAVDDVSALDPGGHIDRLAGLVQRRSLLPRLVRPVLVVVPRVLGQSPPEVLFAVDQQVVQALAP